MRKVIFALLIVFAGTTLMSQTADDYIEVMRSVLKTEKKAAIAEIMTLTSDEALVFWPLYNEFNEKMYTVQTKRIKIIQDYADNYDGMTNEKADELWTAYMGFKSEVLKLSKQYYKKFKKVMPAGKAAKYFQAENKIATLVDFELAADYHLLSQNKEQLILYYHEKLFNNYRSCNGLYICRLSAAKYK